MSQKAPAGALRGAGTLPASRHEVPVPVASRHDVSKCHACNPEMGPAFEQMDLSGAASVAILSCALAYGLGVPALVPLAFGYMFLEKTWSMQWDPSPAGCFYSGYGCE